MFYNFINTEPKIIGMTLKDRSKSSTVVKINTGRDTSYKWF